MKPWPSKNTTGAKLRPSAVSRCKVSVVLLDSRSTSPDCKAVKRCCAVSGTYLTLSAAPKIAADNALQTSTSKPAQWPWLSGAAKPATPVGTPQLIWPACLTLSRVAPACAETPKPSTQPTAASAPNQPLIVIPNSL